MLHSILLADVEEINKFSILKSKNIKEAKKIIEDKHVGIGAIFVNPRLSNNAALDLIYAAIKYKPSAPIYFLADENKEFPLKEEEWTALGVRGIIQKPFTFDQIPEILKPIQLTNDTIEKMEYFSDTEEKMVLGEFDKLFVPIKCTQFLCQNKQVFDLYIRLSSGKFIKLINQNDIFSIEQLEGYLSKGVQNFYILKSTQEELLKKCNEFTKKILNEKRIKIERRTGFVVEQGEATATYLKSISVTNDNIKFATNYTKNVETLLQSAEWAKLDVIENLIEQVRAFEHAVSTTMLCSLVIKNLPDYFQDQDIHRLGLAALFHDIGLIHTLPEHCWNEDVSKMTEQEVKLYLMHPLKSVELLSNIRVFDQELLNAVAQHHMRVNGGFPFHNANVKKSVLSEVIGLCDDFAKLISKSDENPWFNIKTELEKNIYPGFSRFVVEAFVRTFFPKQ